jgi:hypothetical protein
MRTLLPTTLAGILLASAGCASTCCEPERLPLQGRAESPKALFDLIKYAGRSGCDDILYEAMSERTRKEIPGWQFRTFWDSDDAVVYPPQPVPDDAPFVYTLAEVIRGQAGVAEDADCAPPATDEMRFGAAFDTDDEESPRHVKVTYERPREPGKRRPTNVRFHLLVVPEKTADGRTEWRLGLWEQLHDGVGGSPIGEVQEFPEPKQGR